MGKQWLWAMVGGLMILAGAVVLHAEAHTASTSSQGLSHALDAQVERGGKPLVTYLQSQVTANGANAQIADPPDQAAQNLCDAGNCLYSGSSTYTITGQPKTNPGNGLGNDNAYNLERVTGVDENTVAVQVNSTVTMAVGGMTSSRCELYTFRIDDGGVVRPTGNIDCGAGQGANLERDSGGCDPTRIVTCDATGATQEAPSQTMGTVTFTCQPADATQSCSDPQTGATPTPRPGDNYVDGTWRNTNASGSGWGSP